MSFDRTVEPVPPRALSQNAGHHWLIERSYDGHHMQTVCLQWQPGAKRWCHSGDVATGRDVDTRGWLYVEPCPMPQEQEQKSVRVWAVKQDNSVWSQLIDNTVEALELQMRSMMLMQCEQHWESMSRDEKAKWRAKHHRIHFYKIEETTVGLLLATIQEFKINFSFNMESK